MRTILFDNFNTIVTEPNQPLDREVRSLLAKLLVNNHVVIISSNTWRQIQKPLVNQFVKQNDSLLNNLYFVTSSGGSLYQFWARYGWVAAYQTKLNRYDLSKINNIFGDVLTEIGFQNPDKLWGKQFDNRESLVSFSALGHKAPIEQEEEWDSNGQIRSQVVNVLQKRLSSYDVRIEGEAGIEVSQKGINKKYAIDKLMAHLHLSKTDLIYIQNEQSRDNTSSEMGLENFSVSDPEGTKQWICSFLDQESLLLNKAV